MQVFVVGGAVRDALMGLPVNDRDWVVVGSTPEAMTAKGFMPVGKDFPVFLHPQSREEYALARTERKTARGYKGFAVQADPDVTLEEDLARRDLTVNAMAVPEALAHALPSAWAGLIVDPYNGQRDLQAKVLRHVTQAFAEDPVRILRVARFAARFADFSVADETIALMRQMVEDGEVDHLVPERVRQELAKGLMSQKPSRMFEVLRDCGALRVLLPGIVQTAALPPEGVMKVGFQGPAHFRHGNIKLRVPVIMPSLSLLQYRFHGLVLAHDLHPQVCKPCLGLQPDPPPPGGFGNLRGVAQVGPRCVVGHPRIAG
jgi:tRNA nucleotidyltransferase (CCA-adding enzyme)